MDARACIQWDHSGAIGSCYMYKHTHLNRKVVLGMLDELWHGVELCIVVSRSVCRILIVPEYPWQAFVVLLRFCPVSLAESHYFKHTSRSALSIRRKLIMSLSVANYPLLHLLNKQKWEHSIIDGHVVGEARCELPDMQISAHLI